MVEVFVWKAPPLSMKTIHAFAGLLVVCAVLICVFLLLSRSKEEPFPRDELMTGDSDREQKTPGNPAGTRVCPPPAYGKRHDPPRAETDGSPPLAKDKRPLKIVLSVKDLPRDDSLLARASLSIYGRFPDGRKELLHERKDTLGNVLGTTLEVDLPSSLREVEVEVKTPGETRRTARINPDKFVPGATVPLTLSSLSRQTGFVRTPGGVPVVHARVTLSRVGKPPPKTSVLEHWTTEARTGKNGRFSLNNIPEGSYLLVASHPQFGSSPVKTLEPAQLHGGEDLSLVLETAKAVQGMVRESDGRPGAGLPIFLLHQESGLRLRCTANSDGAFFLQAPEGSYTAWPEAPLRKSPVWSLTAGEAPSVYTLPGRCPIRLAPARASDGTELSACTCRIALLAESGLPVMLSCILNDTREGELDFHLLPGIYIFTLRASGFAPVATSPVTLSSGQTMRIVKVPMKPCRR